MGGRVPDRAAATAATAMLGAAALWGTAGGAVAGLSVGGAAAAAAVELTTGVLLTCVAWVRGHRPSAIVAALGWRLPLLGVVEAVNVLLYYESLQMAPVGPAMAVHLTAPVLLTVAGMVRGRVPLSLRAGASLALVCGALVLLADRRADTAYPDLLARLALSFASAVCLALFVTLVSGAAGDVPPMAAAGVQMLVSGLVLSPALWSLGTHRSAVAPLGLIAVLLFAPACSLYWLAMRRLAPITAGTILLAEPFFGTVAAYALYAITLAPWHAVAAALVLGATYLDLTAPAVPTVAAGEPDWDDGPGDVPDG